MNSSKLLLIIACAATLAADADYDLAFAKVTVPQTLPTRGVNVEYLMPTLLKEAFVPAFEKALKVKGVPESGSDELVIMPVRFMEMDRNNVNRKRSVPIPSHSLEEIKTSAQQQGLAIDSPEVLKGFTKGFSDFGVGLGADTLSSGLGEAAKAGGLAVALGLVVHGIDSMTNNYNKFEMVTDIYFNGNRVRIFAMILSGDVGTDEAIVKLNELTADKIASLINPEVKG